MIPPCCRERALLAVSQIGRKRPNEADSDLDDAQSDSSDEEWEDGDASEEVRENEKCSSLTSPVFWCKTKTMCMSSGR